MRQGPLTVAALGADPPDRSTHFHLSLMSVREGVVQALDVAVPSDDLEVVAGQFHRLNTKALTVVLGSGADHGLVWEGLGDMRDVPPPEAGGEPLKSVLPEGDGDVGLRRLIDDSVNLLGELELNERRVDEGLPPLNLAWPWGHGVRVPVPNLVFERGERAEVVSSSLRMVGLSRLCRYRPADRARVGKGLNTRLEFAAATALAADLTIVVLEALSEFRAASMLEEAEWFTREIDDRLLAPLVEDLKLSEGRVTVLAPTLTGGIGVSVASARSPDGSWPFDERLLDESKARQTDLSAAVEVAISPIG